MFVKDLGGTLMPACHLECPYYRVLAYRYSAGSFRALTSPTEPTDLAVTPARERKIVTMNQPILSQIPSSEGQRAVCGSCDHDANYRDLDTYVIFAVIAD
jgi:hypothetical protein